MGRSQAVAAAAQAGFRQILVAALAGQGHQALPLWLCLQSFPLPILFPGVSYNCQGW